jgi:tRNA1Val (adenine37-N6)-methyltransferase
MKKFKNVKGEVLDIGSGSGILGLLVSREYPNLNLNQCELQKPFQFFSLKNAETNNQKTNLFKGSFLQIDFEKKFDICISNPPFYHSNVIKSENENIKIARYNDSMPLEDFIQKSSQSLKNSGKLFFCYDVKQINEILLFLNKYSFNLEVLQFVHPKDSKDATLILVYARKDSKSLTKIMKPLFVFDGLEFTKEVKKIYEKSSTHSIKVDIEQFN